MKRNPKFGVWNTDDWLFPRKHRKDLDSLLHEQNWRNSEECSYLKGRILHMFRLQEAEKLLASIGKSDKLETIKPKIISRKYWVIEDDDELLDYLVDMGIVETIPREDIIAFLLWECYGIKKEESA